MDIFSSLDMLGNLSTDASAGQGHCEGVHAACLAYLDGRPPSEVREVPSTMKQVGNEVANLSILDALQSRVCGV